MIHRIKSIKATDTPVFRLREWETNGTPNVTINCVQENGDLRMVALLWGVGGSNAASEFCNAYIDAIEAMERLNKIADEYSAQSARARKKAQA